MPRRVACARRHPIGAFVEAEGGGSRGQGLTDLCGVWQLAMLRMPSMCTWQPSAAGKGPRWPCFLFPVRSAHGQCTNECIL
jgi:hypothetical protein